MHNIIYSSFLCILKMNNLHKWPLSTQCKQELWKKNPASFDVNAEGGGMQTTPDAGPSLVEEDHAQRKFPSLPIWRVSAFYRQLFLDISTNIIPINAGVGGFHRRCKKKRALDNLQWRPRQCNTWLLQSWPLLSRSEQATHLQAENRPQLKQNSVLPATSAASMVATQTQVVVPEGDKKTWQQRGWL